MPKAEIVFDVFHLNQFVLKAMDEVRKIEAREDQTLFCKTRHLWLYNKERLTEQRAKQLEYIMTKNSGIALAYQMKETFKEVFVKQTREEAEHYLEAWCIHIMTTNLHPFHQVVKTFKRHWQ